MEFIIKYISNRSSEESAQAIARGGKITKPNDTIYAPYTLANWYKEEIIENILNFNSERITKNITLYAKWNLNFTMQRILLNMVLVMLILLWYLIIRFG